MCLWDLGVVLCFWGVFVARKRGERVMVVFGHAHTNAVVYQKMHGSFLGTKEELPCTVLQVVNHLSICNSGDQDFEER